MADPALPVLAGRYRAIDRLGAGGMGVVWRARDEMLHREVAIKEVKLGPGLPEAQRAEMRERTLREARAAARLGHPSIVTVHDVISQDGRPWIVMDLVRGRSLQQVIRSSGPIDPRRAAAIGAAVLDGLALAHSRGIMHRDVKPANIMLADDGGVLLTDFGIATLEGDVQLTSPDALVGSPGYIAPERLRGTGDGPAADLWSLGATLYTAVEGRGPFHRGASAATLGAVLTEETPVPARAGELTPVLLAVLDKDPRRRPGEAVLREALQRVARGLPAGPLLPEDQTAPAGTAKRGRTGLLVGAGLAAVAAVVAGTVVLTSSDGSAKPVPAGPDPRAGRFTAAPDPCSLLTARQVRAVGPTGKPSPLDAMSGHGPSCSWDSGSGTPQIRVTVTHYASVPGKTAPETAKAFFAADRTRTAADAGTGLFGEVGPLRDAGRIGAEAFAFDLTSGDRVYSEVHFRVSNVLVEVNVSRKGKQAGAALRGNALTAARQIAEELNSRD
ncbi:protein kinase [Streptosporangium sp. NPDC004379]|uniref:serine/threonine-protein kinase n=1 Tax=Streptosporangium sp. NPDC004379 TaxID=3366189 RepID=UPI00369A3EF3